MNKDDFSNIFLIKNKNVTVGIAYRKDKFYQYLQNNLETKKCLDLNETELKNEDEEYVVSYFVDLLETDKINHKEIELGNLYYSKAKYLLFLAAENNSPKALEIIESIKELKSAYREVKETNLEAEVADDELFKLDF
ncbi:hypothetical protein [endosymbiont GvMRE of Glomus versiforme]|uniref:hypothetical protein n=1 Tax=endosymbiont GvMRE of Glomus versiforme TaxID=2039283 RepID=UPI000EEE9D78|nr:hypothetical protein [endosymbiont GvMRE of Glomus versiforme]RHZ35499.1 hypothetical protein GvMRE_IIg3 [endosymbiont GvMRE of Glomus versiforme]